MRKRINQNKRVTILIFGETGNGKSSLGNTLLGLNAFKVSNDTKNETKETYGKNGIGENENLFVIDTPGLQSYDGADKQHMIQLVQYVKEHKELNAILVVFNYHQVRFPYNIQTMLKLFCNIFPMKEVGNHIALIFTNSFSKRGLLTPEQKHEKVEKILPEFKKVIEEASGTKLPNNIPTGFIDIDPQEGLDENGKMDLERIITWASFLPNLNVEVIKEPEPDVRIETQDFNEMRIEGEFIIKTIIKKEREVYCHLDGSITYGEWKEKERKEEKIINPEIEKIKKLNLDHEEMMKKIQEDNEKKMKALKEENQKIQEKAHKQFLEIVEANKKNDDEIKKLAMSLLQNEQNRKENDKQKRKKKLKKKYLEYKNNALNSKEDRRGECSSGKTEFSAGIIEENELVNMEEERVYSSEWKFGHQESTFEGEFNDKIIVGWKLKSCHENDEGGFWERKKEILGTSSYKFFISSYFSRGCNWKLRVYTIKKEVDNYSDD